MLISCEKLMSILNLGRRPTAAAMAGRSILNLNKNQQTPIPSAKGSGVWPLLLNWKKYPIRTLYSFQVKHTHSSPDS
jgi:hypothetical protein